MIIKHPETIHIPALTALWQQAFGDTPEFIDGFFRTGFSENRCLLAEENGQLLAALYWFDCVWEGKKVAYLYAIATDESQRGKGICTKLMQNTHQHLQKTGYCGALLMPAEESLEAFYGKMGYLSLDSDQLKTTLFDPDFLHTDSLQMITPAEYLQLRQSYLPQGSVHHTATALEYLGTFARFYRCDNGICCGDPAFPIEYLPGYPGDPAMYLPLTADKTLPKYFAIALA